MHIPVGRARRAAVTLAVAGVALSACGGQTTSTVAPTALTVSVQNSTLLPGVDRLGIALTDGNRPVLDAAVRVDITDAAGRRIGSEPLQFIGRGYGSIPVYLGAAAFPATGRYHLDVRAAVPSQGDRSGAADVEVVDRSPELPVGHSVTEVAQRRQRVARDVNGDLTLIDSGIADGRPAPDPFHDATIQDGLDQHRPMLLFFGEPGHCVSQTCGPTVSLLLQMYPAYRDRILFEHIEVKDPAGGLAFNPVLVGFGLTSEPWVYLVTASGVVADRFEGPVTLEQLEAAADGTIAGRVPAVDVRVQG